jgi:hypothetical protein
MKKVLAIVAVAALVAPAWAGLPGPVTPTMSAPSPTVTGGGVRDWPHPYKWQQMQALDTYGAASWIDLDTPSDAVTADDFLCDVTGPITDIEFAGWSTYGNQYIDKFRIQFWTDVPATPNDESHPGTLLYSYDVSPADAADPLKIGWQDRGDGTFKIDLPQENWFYQQGSATNPIVYWISIQGLMVTDGYFDAFYWNFRDRNIPTWNDDAAFASDYFTTAPWSNWGVDAAGAVNLYEGPFPTSFVSSLDMAFNLTGLPEPGSLALVVLGGLTLLRRR